MGSKVNAICTRYILMLYHSGTVPRGLPGQFPEACWNSSQRLPGNPPRHMLKWNECLSIVQLHSISDFIFDFLFQCSFNKLEWNINKQYALHQSAITDKAGISFHQASTSVIDQSFQSSSSCFPTRTSVRTLLNPHGVATAEKTA